MTIDERAGIIFRMCSGNMNPTYDYAPLIMRISSLIKEAVADERAECAKIAEENSHLEHVLYDGGCDCADAIRSRSKGLEK